MGRLLAALWHRAEEPKASPPNSEARGSIEAQLRHVQELRPCPAHLSQPLLEALDVRQADHARRIEIFERYRSCQEIFTPKEWEVIWLCHHEGVPDIEAARALRKTRSTITSRLTAARRKKERHEQKLRQERL